MPGGVPVVPATPDDADFQKWKAAQAGAPAASSPLAPVPDEAEFQAWKAAQSGGPGFISRGISNIITGAAHAIFHPIDTAENLVTAPVRQVGTAMSPTSASDVEQLNTLGRTGKAGPVGMLPYRNTDIVTPRERNLAAAQVAANVVAPGLLGKVLPAVGTLGKIGTLATVGAGEGALNNPNDPAAGAVTGAIMTPLAGAVGSGVAKGANTLAELNAVRKATNAVPTAGAETIGRLRGMKATDKVNYGVAKAEADAAGGSTPGTQALINEPDIAPLADMVRTSFARQGLPTDDASILMQIHSELSAKEGPLIDKLLNTTGSKATIGRVQNDIQAIKGRIRNVLASPSQRPPMMFDVPAQTYETNPVYSSGHEGATGPIFNNALTDYTTPPANPSLAQARRDFPSTSTPAMQGPGGPAFQLRANPVRLVTPGVSIETPAMRVQTAPAQDVPPLAPSYPMANDTHAAAMQSNRQYAQGFNDAKTIVDGKIPVGKTPEATQQAIATKSPEAISQRIAQMTPQQAGDYLSGQLAYAKATQGHLMDLPDIHASMFGTVAKRLGGQATVYNRLAPYIDALYKQMGQSGLPQNGILGTMMAGVSPQVAQYLSPLVNAQKP